MQAHQFIEAVNPLDLLATGEEKLLEITVSDNSMVPEMRKGSRAFVDTQDHRLENGGMYCFVHEGLLEAITFRRCYLEGSKVLCRATNPEFPEFTLEPGVDYEGFRLIGRVVGAVVTF